MNGIRPALRGSLIALALVSVVACDRNKPSTSTVPESSAENTTTPQAPPPSAAPNAGAGSDASSPGPSGGSTDSMDSSNTTPGTSSASGNQSSENTPPSGASSSPGTSLNTTTPGTRDHTPLDSTYVRLLASASQATRAGVRGGVGETTSGQL